MQGVDAFALMALGGLLHYKEHVADVGLAPCIKTNEAKRRALRVVQPAARERAAATEDVAHDHPDLVVRDENF